VNAPPSNSGTELLRVDDLVVEYRKPAAFRLRAPAAVRAVDGVSFHVGVNETLGLVGESGCGKSTVARAILRLLDPSAGSVRFDGQEIAMVPQSSMRAIRPRMQIVFQDPSGSLNFRMRARRLLAEPMQVARWSTDRIAARTDALMELVGLPRQYLEAYPHQLSGGQKQRLVLARALALEPALVVCDEPVSALDVSIQAQILNLLKDIQDRLGVSYLFVSHDLGVIRQVAHRVAVMYLGRIVEEGPTAELFTRPLHPYTQALLSAIPEVRRDTTRPRVILQGDLPSLAQPPSGCRFRTRCPAAVELCSRSEPEMRGPDQTHRAACHFAGTVDVTRPAASTGHQTPSSPVRAV
jgi:oligopeptide transport system ATP-binding protein